MCALNAIFYPLAARAKLSLGTSVARLRKTAADKKYPHPAGELGELMVKGAAEFEEETLFAQALTETGETLNRISETQHAFDDEVNQNLLDPLKSLLDKEVKEVMVSSPERRFSL